MGAQHLAGVLEVGQWVAAEAAAIGEKRISASAQFGATARASSPSALLEGTCSVRNMARSSTSQRPR